LKYKIAIIDGDFYFHKNNFTFFANNKTKTKVKKNVYKIQ